MKRKITVVTGSRAEYGVLYWLLKEIDNDPDLVLQLVVTGMHLSPEFGLTYKQIEKDGFKIAVKVESQLSSNSSVGVAKSTGLGMIGFSDAFDQLKPDVVVLVGDRFETLAAACVAMFLQIPIAHIGGGEATEGAFDESIRHAITKMSHIHFVCADKYKKRVVQLGESTKQVYAFGTPALDYLERTKLLNKKDLEKLLGFKFSRLTFLATYHPATLQPGSAISGLKCLLRALDHFPEARIIFTGANADPEGNEINKYINEYLKQNPEKGRFFSNLGQMRYFSLLKHADVVLGNSSSGLIDVPYFAKPTINVGDRQRGRLMASSVINCSESSKEMIDAISLALSPEFQVKLKNIISPYGKGDVSRRIKSVLKSTNLRNIIIKRFFDIDHDVQETCDMSESAKI